MSKLLDSVSNEIRKRNYSLQTDKTYRKWIKEFILFNNKKHPSTLGAEEIKEYLTGNNKIICGLLYGSGLRLMEALRLRIKDIDLQQNILVVHNGKEKKDRITLIPEVIKKHLIELIQTRKIEHKSLNTTMIYTHLINKGAFGVRSPLD